MSKTITFAFHIGCNNRDEMLSTRALFNYSKSSSTDNLTMALTEIFAAPPSVFTPRLYSLSQKLTPSPIPLAVLLPSTFASLGVYSKSEAQLELESQD